MSLINNNPYDEQFQKIDPPKGKKPLLSNVSKLYGDTYRGRGTGYGSSLYDKDINWDADINESDIQGSLEEFRSQNQPWTHKFGAGVGRAALKAGTEIAKLPGVIGGLVAAPFQEDGEGFDMAFNNAWIKSIDEFSDEAKQEYLPVYVKKAVKEGNLWDNISSIDFWATDGADGIGFVAAMLAPGAIIEGLNVGSKLISGASKLAKTAGMFEKVETATNALAKVGINLAKVTPGKINSIMSVASNTIFEAGSEAKSVSDSITADADKKLRDGLISQEQYDYIINVQRPIAMRDTFVTNAAILIGPNTLMHSALWGKSVEKLTRTADSIKDRILNLAKRYGEATLSEGFWEEGTQSATENYFKDKALQGKLGKNSDFNLGDFTKSYIDTISSTEGLKAIFLGGVLGGVMTSTQGRKSDVKNRKNTNEILDNIDSSVDKFNNTFENDIYLKDKNNNYIFEKDDDGNDTTKRKVDPVAALKVAKDLNYSEQQLDLLDVALREGNEEVVNDIKREAVFNLIIPAIHNGKAGLEALKTKLNNDSQFNEILMRDNTDESKSKTKSFVNNVLEQASHLQEENEKFKNFSKEVITLDNKDATQQDKDNYLNILNSNYLNAKSKLFTYNKQLSEIELKRKQAFDELGVDPLYDSLSESPTSKMKSGTVSNDEMYERAEKTKQAIENNSLLKELDLKYNNLRTNINKVKSDISQVWSGTNNDSVKKSFNKYINNNILLSKKIQKLEPLLNDASQSINDSTSLAELKSIEDSLEPEVKELLLEKLNQRKIELNELEKETINESNNKFNQEIETKELLTGDKTESFVNTIQEENFEQPTNTDNENLVFESNKLQDSKYKELHFNNNRIHSTNKETGETLPWVNKEWLEYEKIPSNKIGTKLHFTLNNNSGENKNLKLAFQLAEGILTKKTNIDNIINSNKNRINSKDELREYLAKYLPLNIGFENSETKSSIDTYSDNDVNSYNETFNKTIKNTRLQIVNHILDGGKLEDITTEISGQMPGILQIDITEENKVPENSILQLQYFQLNNLVNEKNELTKKGYQYVRENLFNVIDFGQLQNAKGEQIVYNTKDGIPLAKGEFYLKIPMANGEPFYLKLNTPFISENKANVIYEIYKYRFNSQGIINKGLTLNEISKENSELVNLIKSELKDEYDLILKHKKSDEISLKDIIDIIIYDNNNSDKVKFLFKGTGVENQSVLIFGKQSIESLEELENKKDDLIEWITTTKRQNIKFGKVNNLGKVNTNSIDYLNYLLSNKILNTNAVVGRNEDNTLKPTFNGYTNIYWKNININNKNEDQQFKDSGARGVDLSLLGIKPQIEKNVVKTTELINIQKQLLERFKIDNEEDNISEFKVGNIKYLMGTTSYVLLNQSNNKFIESLDETLNLIDSFNKSIKVAIARIDLNNVKNSWEKIRNYENNSVSLQNNIQFTHQIEGSEENKKIKEMQSKVETEKLSLSDEQIDKFIKLNEFSKYIEIYSQEKGVKEDNLTDQDYLNIIQNNYTKEQIDKVCKN